MDTWEMAAAERQKMADRLEGLPDDAWQAPTLCEGWAVRDAVAHMTAIGSMSARLFFGGMLRNKMSFDAFQAEGIRKYEEGKSPAEMLAAFKATIASRSKPPGPKTTVLGEILVHGEDIFRALNGSFSEHPPEHVIAVADFYKRNSFPLKVKKRISGVTLRMIDADWSYGSGPEIVGPGIAVLMAMVGRKAALGDLSGEGVTVLAARS